MIKLVITLSVFGTLLLLSTCGGNNSPNSDGNKTPAPRTDSVSKIPDTGTFQGPKLNR